jgi:hypothetical protein
LTNEKKQLIRKNIISNKLLRKISNQKLLKMNCRQRTQVVVEIVLIKFMYFFVPSTYKIAFWSKGFNQINQPEQKTKKPNIIKFKNKQIFISE